jgi:hypothetical protein
MTVVNAPATKRPSIRLKNVQTNNIFELTDREQISKCFGQTFNSQVECEQWVDGRKETGHVIRPIPRFEVLSCSKELADLIPQEEKTTSIREKLLGKDLTEQTETLEDLKKFCYLKGIHHSPSIGYEKLKERVDAYKALNKTTPE